MTATVTQQGTDTKPEIITATVNASARVPVDTKTGSTESLNQKPSLKQSLKNLVSSSPKTSTENVSKSSPHAPAPEPTANVTMTGEIQVAVDSTTASSPHLQELRDEAVAGDAGNYKSKESLRA